MTPVGFEAPFPKSWLLDFLIKIKSESSVPATPEASAKAGRPWLFGNFFHFFPNFAPKIWRRIVKEENDHENIDEYYLSRFRAVRARLLLALAASASSKPAPRWGSIRAATRLRARMPSLANGSVPITGCVVLKRANSIGTGCGVRRIPAQFLAGSTVFWGAQAASLQYSAAGRMPCSGNGAKW